MNLEQKFSTLETQLATQHGETIDALNALLSALGAPPPAPGATLADVLGALNQIALMLAGLRTDMATQHAAQLAQLQLLNSSTDLLLQNTSWNTKQLLLGLAALDPCKQCEIPSYELPPIDETPVTVDQEHCKRVQALLYAILRFTTKLDIISSLGAGFNVETLKAAFTEILTEVGAAGNLSISLPSFNELLTLVAACVEYIASNIFAGNDLQSSFMLIKSDLIQPLYDANTANAGIAAYRAGIDASSLPTPIKRVLKAIGYIALFNLYYGTTPLDTTGFDGTLCAPAQIGECYTPASDEVRTFMVTNTLGGQHASYNAVVWPATFANRSASYSGHQGGSGNAINIVADNGELFVLNQDLYGYWSRGATVYTNDEISIATGSSWTQITVHTTSVFVFPDVPDMVFTLCPPDSPPIM